MPAACRGTMDFWEVSDLAHKVSKALETWYPGLGDLEVLAVDGGAIYAHGTSDVDIPTSGLHIRTNFGIVSLVGYL
ncbi:MAG: hypothetical protein O7C75_12165 [Verrucomicrobia bacterium]|nr:hypothetical protein [Verrucomicrobiota bacterium]